jgi:hypothetical protein
MNIEQVISDAGWSKLDFVERDKCKPVMLSRSMTINLEKPVMFLCGTKWRKCGFRLRMQPQTSAVPYSHDRLFRSTQNSGLASRVNDETYRNSELRKYLVKVFFTYSTLCSVSFTFIYFLIYSD